ncbi:VapE domain-containing protein [Nostoc punctiforme]|uniref:Virulence-associated E family protein n=1 Tax=Nostoc punctiforme (strain ATCC 29133 / PCC 73102) TaxID=63737 RepID=B2J1H6_NOSP7|nr:VapE domain-containing protein [Nostoc punctiforme]ACC80337.1 virulence-associated E family protein [Nostoc punctiforme PCC 73102]
MILSTPQAVDTIASHHWEEWQLSGVSAKIIQRNVRTLYDSREVDKVLNRNTKSRQKHSEHLVPCWMVSGVNPLTGENTLEGVQAKPDVSPLGKDGKVNKYLGAVGYGASPLFLDTGVEYCWQQVLADKSIPIIITEGAKKAGAGLTIGLPTISIPGVSTCRKMGRLHSWIEAFAGFGRTFYLCFDADILHKRPVQQSLINIARDLAATGSKVMVIKLPSIELKGMDDFIAAKGEEAFKQLIEDAPTIEEWKKDLEEQRKNDTEYDDEERTSKVYRAYKIIRDGWGDNLRLNQLKNIIELNDQKIELNQLRLGIAREFDMDVQIGDGQAIVEAIASQNAYHPVVEYLDEVAARYSTVDPSILDNLATKYFGTDDPLHNIYLKKMLISAVARARRPGCKVDTALILVGEQGINKSSFWRELFGRDWFTDELSDGNEKDELMKLHKFWGLEIPEIEHMYKRKDISSIKKFMSSSVDAFRAPYGLEVKEHPRACVLVGTSNETELLNDPTGNRRFWIIPVTDDIPIDIEQLVRERDLIWASANALYEKGYQWWLSPAESKIHNEASKDFQSVDPWTDTVLAYARQQGETTTSEILRIALGIELGRQEMLYTKRVSAILRSNGWEQYRQKIGNSRPWAWRLKSSSENQKSLGNKADQGRSPGSLFQNFELETELENQKSLGNKADQGRSPGSLPQNLQSDPPSTQQRQITPEPLQQETFEHCDPPVIRLDPPTLPNFSENNFVVQAEGTTTDTETRNESSAITCPEKCSYYKTFEGIKPFTFKVESDFGAVEVSAEPYHRFQTSGESKIWLIFKTPDGQALTKSIKATPDKKVLPRLAKECGVIQQWEEKVRKDFSSKVENASYKFKVQILGDDDYEWIEGCILKTMPNRPSVSHFIFTTPKKTVVTSHLGEFEEM